MVFKNLFSGNSIKPDFTFSQKGNIWRMYFNNSGITVGETRDLYTKEAFLYSLNYESKEVYLRDFPLDEKWWFSIEGVTNDYFIISRFLNPEMPEPIGIHVHDIKSGELIWKNDELILFFVTDEFVYGYKQLFESKIFYKMNTSTGGIIEEYREEVNIYDVLSEKSIHDEKQYEGYFYPEIYVQGDEEDVIKEYFPVDVNSLKLEGPVEYIHFNNYLIYNYHEKKGIDIRNIERQVLSNIINIIDLEKNKVVFKEALNKETSSYVPDSFFIKDGYLFFIREKKELTAVNLGK
ncbi:MAG: DUF4905 domain-containing protein [Ignavibacteriae bacterium]|nr:MAG: DUF4905 domain-containing protein [Ignavibacteriota bacterium]